MISLKQHLSCIMLSVSLLALMTLVEENCALSSLGSGSLRNGRPISKVVVSKKDD